MAGGDLTIEILKNIRDEIRGVNGRLDAVNGRLDVTNERLDVVTERLDVTIGRLDVTNERLDTVESTLLDLAEHQRLVERHTRVLAERDLRQERRVDELAVRVEKLETD